LEEDVGWSEAKRSNETILHCSIIFLRSLRQHPLTRRYAPCRSSQLATVTIPLDATSSSVETYQVDPSGTLFMEVKKGLENFGKTSQRQSMRVLKIEREDSEKTGAEAAVVPQPSEGGDEGAAEGAPA